VVAQDRIPAELLALVAVHQRLHKKEAHRTEILLEALRPTRPQTRAAGVAGAGTVRRIKLAAMAVAALSFSEQSTPLAQYFQVVLRKV
jgi:hypothetical protein